MSTRRRLSRILVLSHAGIGLAVAGFLALASLGSFHAAALAEARKEAERSAAEARRRVRDWQREPAVVADLLVEQPSLPFYLQRGQLTKTRELIRDVGSTSGVGYVAVLGANGVVGERGTRPPAFDGGWAFDAAGEPWTVVRRPVPYARGYAIVVAEPLGDRLAQKPAVDGVQVGVHRVPAPGAASPAAGSLAAALASVASSGDSETYERVGGRAALRVLNLRDAAGRPVALLAAGVDEGWVQRRVAQGMAAFGLSALAVVALAAMLAVLLARRIARPLATVAAAARRLGEGDLETPVPTLGTVLAEPASLAEDLEGMRQRVHALTRAERQQREEMDVLLDGVDEGIAGLDDSGRVLHANRRFLELLGGDRADVVGRQLDDVLSPAAEGASAGDDLVQPLLTAERLRAPGRLAPLVARRLRAAPDRQVLLLREENALEAARAMRDHVLANLSHEFQTPLSAQIASVELLRDHVRAIGDAVAMRLVDAQYRGTLRLSQLVDNLLDSLRLESGEMRLRREPLELSATVLEAVELMQPLVEHRRQRVLPALSDGVHVSGDPQRLLGVVVNLLANANKFSPDDTSIWVDLEPAPDRVTLWVEDEGPGLPPASTASDLFAPFRRSPSEEPSQRGTGLGLAIVHAVVQAHGGVVQLAEPQRGSGARIGIVLPLAEAA